uniref:Spatacsin C-terminal domain-containing protein n=1 Tax=Oncorhynchus tshawytscha TaxID=74940 RepID=A0A8C8JA47_ONCTS
MIMINMLHRSETRDNCALEVALIPESNLCENVVDTAKAKMAQGCSLLCCLSGAGVLTVGDISESKAPGRTVDGTYTDFAWEEVTVYNGARGNPRLLAVSSECELTLYELECYFTYIPTLIYPYEFVTYTKLHCLHFDSAGVAEVVSLRLLSFVDARSFLLLNSSVVVQLQWQQGAEPDTLSCCSIVLPPKAPLDTCTDYQLCRGILFVLTTAGVIYVFDSAEGRKLASVDLPSYHTAGLGEDEPAPYLDSFCLLQVSPDLGTAVAATQSNTAFAVDLNHYFRMYPEHLMCRVVPSRPPLRPQGPCDEDSLSSSIYSHTVLGTSFSTDQSWEARLTSLYNKAKATPPSSPQTLGAPWFKDFPHIECGRAAIAAKLSQSRVPSGGATMQFSVPYTTTPVLLSVSEFSTVLTFVSPGNSETTVAFWDLQSQSVTYHRPTSPTVPIQRTAEEQLSLLLKTSGLSLVLFAVSQEELLNRLMVFGSAGTVDSLCHLNEWGRCAIPIHALQAGLKNHQLDTVDFFLKSKKNVLTPPSGYILPDQSAAISTQSQLKSKDLCPALDLLRCAIRDNHTEAQSRQFSEQLLSITLAFLNTQVRAVLSATEELDENLQECVEILDSYVSDLRTFMKRFPWPTGGDTSTLVPSPIPVTEEVENDYWSSLSSEEVVERAVLTRQIPRAQAYLRSQNRPDQRLEELRSTGLRLAFNCLTHKDLEQATALLRNMGFNVKKQLHNICLYTDDRGLRDFVVEELSKQSYLSDEETQRVEFIKQIEALCAVPETRSIRYCVLLFLRVPQMSQTDPGSKSLLEELVDQRGSQSEQTLWSSLRLDWVRHWDHNTQRAILLFPHTHTVSSCDPGVLWSYLTSHHDQRRVTEWIESLAAQNGDPSSAPQWPALTAEVVNNNTRCSAHMRNHILYMLLCGDPNLVGIKLLDHIPTVPLGELGCTVELLILAHDCFSLTCNMEGIVRVLQAARHLSHAHLAHSEHYGLLVRLLTGIGRYNDMTYIFDLLNQNHRFEMLLRKKVESNFRLKTALLDYIKRCLPGDSEKYNMVALCFSMCREIGENHEGAARTQLKLIESQPWVTPELRSALIKVLTLLKDAAESYSKDSCVRQAARCVKMAKLTTLQLHFLNHGQDQRVINLRQSDLLGAIVALPRCYQAFVLSEAYDYSPDWAEVLYQKVILSGDFAYLEEFRLHRPLPACLFEDISQKLTHNTPPSSAGQNLKRLLQHCDDVYTYYKLAYEHKFFDVANMLLQDSKTSSYLNDRLGTR